MAGGHGGAREGAGRKKGAKTLITEEALKRAGEGETPLEYMLRIMRNEEEPNDRRDKMALGAAPYVHSKAVELTDGDGGPLSVEVVSFADTPAERVEP